MYRLINESNEIVSSHRTRKGAKLALKDGLKLSVDQVIIWRNDFIVVNELWEQALYRVQVSPSEYVLKRHVSGFTSLFTCIAKSSTLMFNHIDDLVSSLPCPDDGENHLVGVRILASNMGFDIQAALEIRKDLGQTRLTINSEQDVRGLIKQHAHHNLSKSWRSAYEQVFKP